MKEMQTIFQKTIQQYQMISPHELVIVGVSGGPDSLTLLHLLKELQAEIDFRIHVAHVDHSFRGQEAEAEARWVQETAEKWGLPSTVRKVNVQKIAREKGISSQEAGHLVRRKFFLELLDQLGAQKIALGHQADDQAETLLMHFLVGTGSEGLQGIRPSSFPFVRPLIFLRREEIEAYCQENNLAPRRDPSNSKNIYLRNKIRNQVIPWLEEKVNPNLVATLNRTALIMQGEEEFLQEETQKVAEKFVWRENNCIYISIREWVALSPGIQRRLIRVAYQSLGEGQGLSFVHVEEIRALAEGGQVSKVLQLPGKVQVEKGYGELAFSNQSRAEQKAGGIAEHLLKIPGVTYLSETGQQIFAEIVAAVPEERIDFKKNIKQEFGLEKEALKEQQTKGEKVYLPWKDSASPYYVRSRRPGDRFSPLGLQGSKKLKDYFIEKKIPQKKRDTILLIVSGKEIICVPGLAVAEGWELKDHKGKCLVLTISKA